MLPTIELIEIFWSLLGPWQYLYIVLTFLPTTIWRLLERGDIKTLFNRSRLKHAWFSSFWAIAGPRIRQRNGPRITALLNGRVTNARIIETQVTPGVGGVVLDIGPGSGSWVDVYAEVRDSGAVFQKIYGVEPSRDAHEQLSKSIREAGLEDLYEILPVGVDALESVKVKGDHYKDERIEKGTVDCIVSVLCLCSIPEPEQNIAKLYQYLKKGGRWYVFEHVKTQQGRPMQLYQGMCSSLKPCHQDGN
jgi:SAM-dependent methyltransferase